jgi:predicted dehydrogenase
MSLYTNRREFLQASAAGIAATASWGATQSATAQVAGSKLSASNKLVVGLIGCGGRGTHDAANFMKQSNVELAYICDVDETRREKAAKELNVDARRAVGDLRKILDDKSVDAIIIATPDHWHSPAAILACNAGKHVYVEKPISHNIREGRLLIEASQRNKRLVQHGTQVRSTSMMSQAVNLLRDGIIGDVLVAKCWNIQRRRSIGHDKAGTPPTGLDYDTWIGPAQFVAYQKNRCHEGWHWWYDFGTGDMGNDGVHDVDYTRWGLGVETHPTKISAIGGKFFFDDDQQFPDTQQIAFEYPGDGKPGAKRMLIFEMRLWSTNYPHNTDSGAEFYGTKGQMYLSRRGKLEVRGDRNAPIEVAMELKSQDDVAHVRNFCDAIRNGGKVNADALTGHLTSSLCHLGNIATRLGRSLTFDPQTEQFVDDKEANALVARTYREHWGTPRSA